MGMHTQLGPILAYGKYGGECKRGSKQGYSKGYVSGRKRGDQEERQK